MSRQLGNVSDQGSKGENQIVYSIEHKKGFIQMYASFIASINSRMMVSLHKSSTINVRCVKMSRNGYETDTFLNADQLKH